MIIFRPQIKPSVGQSYGFPYLFLNFLRLSLFFYLSQACSEDVFNFFQRQTNNSYRFISELMDVFLKVYCMAGVHQQPEQSNYLAEGQI